MGREETPNLDCVKMKRLIDPMPVVIEQLRRENPTRRFALNNEYLSLWVWLPATNQWQVIITSLMNRPAEGLLIEPGDGPMAMTVDADGKWGWNNVFKPQCTIFEPLTP